MTQSLARLPPSVRSVLPADVLAALSGAAPEEAAAVEEIRLRVGRPLELVGAQAPVRLIVTAAHLRHVLEAATASSLYAVERELRQGFVTIAGGHRVGLAGRAVTDAEGRVKTLRDFSSACIRVAREHPGCAAALAPHLGGGRGRPLSALLVGPPLSGKTTLLRDVARQLGDGIFWRGVPALRVGVVDERSELAGCYRGVPQFDIGRSTDVLDACPKVEGMYMLLRAMAPQVIVTDEIGGVGDVRAIVDAARAGVGFVGTLHAAGPADLAGRPAVAELIAARAIERFVFVERSGPRCRVARVCDGHLRELALPPASAG